MKGAARTQFRTVGGCPERTWIKPAAAKLGIPRQTLESKIRRLGIDKYGQKRQASE
jgi:hypothetical protein